MLRALNTAATGMEAQSANLSTIAHNVANSNTNGFKKSRAEFEDLLYQATEMPGTRSSATTHHVIGTQIGSGAKVSAVKRINTQGSPNITNNPFDLMINGDGHFGIIMPNNDIKYTRDGSFALNAQGTLVTNNGNPVFPTITFPSNTLTVNITSDGHVEAFIQGQVEPQQLGVIPVFTFINPAGLKTDGGNLYSQSVASGAPIQNIAGQESTGVLQQGALEISNVSIMTEMTDMIKAQRTYEMNSKVMGVADQFLQTVNNIR
jgi:flagellar basal-body rod protein FlgG